MNKELIAIFEYLEREKGIKRDVIIAAIEESLLVAARKNYLGAQDLTVTIDSRTGVIEAACSKEVVEKVTIPIEEISVKDALKIDPDAELGEDVRVTIAPKELGRIAAQKAKQIITQKIRSAERDVICEEYRHRTNELISGTVKRFLRGSDILVDLGKVEALLPTHNYPRGERYHIGDKIYALLLEVRDDLGECAEVILSRSSPEFVRQLFLQEVPELNDSTIQIRQIIREAGYRTKLTVESTDPKVDPVGACIGMRGSRVKNIVRELNNEKIDIIPHAIDPIELLQNALAPIEIRKLGLNEDETVVSIVVEDDDFAAVIGKKGMNARLNSQLIGKELEVQRLSEYNKTLEIARLELAESDDPTLDEPLTVDGINSLILEHLIDAGYATKRKLLLAKSDELAMVPGLSQELADKILEQIGK